VAAAARFFSAAYDDSVFKQHLPTTEPEVFDAARHDGDHLPDLCRLIQPRGTTWVPATSPGMTPCANRQIRIDQALTSHFFMKLFLAAPASGLPSALTALLSQVSSSRIGVGAST
jgi:hypothetical protein